ncbi:inositol monophosphatase family protein [Roseicitreum antarcticum]|uniref:Fructose-1,6-bisphosphatase n=1 Tax=Roseicitreum antarcticum TaxID=564137 RepID=A0A1H2TNB8_9RHOB|nr:inositol monophosphatase [Roseicitreum antarcticum]SDW45332.1 fructose-1,6-bisphosphatase [Roseicitreum antarcticum]
MKLSETERDGLIAAVRDTARTEIMPRFRRLDAGDVDTKSAPGDLVTVADRASELRIAAAVRRLMPDAAIVGEEAVFEDPAILNRLRNSGRVVIVDPIDGTWNFASGLAVFGVILAVVEDGETRFGLLYDPVMDDWIMAEKGRGAWFCRPDEAPLRLTGPAPRHKDEAHAFVPLFLYPDADRPRIAAQFPQWGRVTSMRCSCHEYRTLAFGHADLIAAPTPKPWDHAAGVLVVEELGGAARASGPGYDVTDTMTTLTVATDSLGAQDWDADFR